MFLGVYTAIAVIAVIASTWLGSAPWALVACRTGSPVRFAFPPYLAWLLGVAVWLASVVAFGASRAILAIAAGAVLIAAWIRWRQQQVRKRIAANQEQCVELIETMGADLRSGGLPHAVLERLGKEFDIVEPVHGALVRGADPVEAWKAVADNPGYRACIWVAAAWAIASESGAPLSDILDSVADDVRNELDLRRDVAAAVAPARSTALLMAVLPVLALAMGAGMGADPLDTITQSVWGAGSVTLGVIFAIAGIFWVDRIAEGVEQQ